MKKTTLATLAALATVALTSTARADNTAGRWTGKLKSLHSTCASETLDTFRENYLIYGSHLYRQSDRGGIYGNTRPGRYVMWFGFGNVSEIDVRRHGSRLLVTYSDTFGGDPTLPERNCTNVWQGEFRRK